MEKAGWAKPASPERKCEETLEAFKRESDLALWRVVHSLAGLMPEA
jgi:hypothetical protein